MRAICLLAVIVCAGTALQVAAAPKPETAARGWQLDISFHDPQRITVPIPGQGEVTYWYMLFTVTNRTGRDIEFFPSITLVTDQLEIVLAGEGVHPRAYDFIAARHKKEYPFFAKPTDITGPLLQGVENSRTSAAVFKTFSNEASGFRVFTSGLSGELARVANPAFDPTKEESESNPRAFVLRRTLEIVYDLPGDAENKDAAVPMRRSRGWVMR